MGLSTILVGAKKTMGLVSAGTSTIRNVGFFACFEVPKETLRFCILTQKEIALLPFRLAGATYMTILGYLSDKQPTKNISDVSKCYNSEEDSVLESPLEDSVLEPPLEDSVLESPLEDSVLESPLEDSVLDSLLEESVLSSAEEGSVLSSTKERSLSSSAEEGSVLSSTKERSLSSSAEEGSLLNSTKERSPLSSAEEGSILSSTKERSTLSSTKERSTLSSSEVEESPLSSTKEIRPLNSVEEESPLSSSDEEGSPLSSDDSSVSEYTDSELSQITKTIDIQYAFKMKHWRNSMSYRFLEMDDVWKLEEPDEKTYRSYQQETDMYYGFCALRSLWLRFKNKREEIGSNFHSEARKFFNKTAPKNITNYLEVVKEVSNINEFLKNSLETDYLIEKTKSVENRLQKLGPTASTRDRVSGDFEAVKCVIKNLIDDNISLRSSLGSINKKVEQVLDPSVDFIIEVFSLAEQFHNMLDIELKLKELKHQLEDALELLLRAECDRDDMMLKLQTLANIIEEDFLDDSTFSAKIGFPHRMEQEN